MQRENVAANDVSQSATGGAEGLSRRAALAAGAGAAATGALVLGTGAGAASATAPQRDSLKRPVIRTARTLESMFDEAASRYGVPATVLAAVGWTETHLDGHGGQPSIANGYGVMHLADNPTNQTLAEAARRTGLSTAALRTDTAANILGGAAVLRARADAQRLSSADRASVAAWLPVTAAYSAAADSEIASMYAAGVSQALAEGFSVNGLTLKPKTFIPWDQLRGGSASSSTYTAPQASPQPIGATMPSVVSAWANSANYATANRPNDYAIKYIIIHVTQGSYASAVNWFKNASARVSAHYVVRSSDGKISQCVDTKNVAWHAGNRSYNYASIGIEHEGFISQSSWFTDAMYRSSAALVRSLCDKYGIPRTRARILGHKEVPQATHTDPGPYWNWTKYMSYVNAGSTTPTWQLILDNTSPEFSASANWQTSTYSPQKLGANYRYAAAQAITDTAWYSANIPSNGRYVIECRYPTMPTYNNLTPYVISSTAGNETVYVNQQKNGAIWRSLGTYNLTAGYKRVVGVSRWAKGTGWVIADGIRISRIG